MAPTTTTSTSTTDRGGATMISALHQDIIEHHILTRLDCLTLTSLSCTSSYFHSLSSQETLWRDICISMWPSVNDPRVFQLISSFPGGHRSFISHSFPLLTTHNQPRNLNCRSVPVPSKLISAVDVWYRNSPICSRVIEFETGSGWFQHSPFRVDLLDPKEVLHTPVKIINWDDGTWRRELEENLTLSWVIIDPTRKQAGNFSSLRPVSMQRHWLTGEVRVEYATVLGCDQVGFVECKVVVTCGGREQGELHVREACMQVEDMDGNYLTGRDSSVILSSAMEFGKRRSREKDEGRMRHEEYLEMKRRRKERNVFRERVLDMACVTVFSVLLAFSTFFIVGR